MGYSIKKDTKIKINGGRKLTGDIFISGAKNSIVSLIPATILSDGIVELSNCPNISDVVMQLKFLRHLNSEVNHNDSHIVINNRKLANRDLLLEEVSKLRASYYYMGALLGKFKYVKIGMPGGCNIGARPIDFHLRGFEALGASVNITDEYIELKADTLTGANITLEKSSVGATINILLAAVLASGTTIIQNAAREPEVSDLVDMLVKMGANIEGKDSSTLQIKGVLALKGTKHEVIPDRIQAGTYIVYAAAVGDEVTIHNLRPDHITSLLNILSQLGVKYDVIKNKITVYASDSLKPIDVSTAIYPGFPTDLQQVLLTLTIKANGESHISESIYESRFRNCPELIKMGAKIDVDQLHAIVSGPNQLVGTTVKATDLRGGASVLLAGLMANGTTYIENPHHIFRGYENVVETLSNLGANISIIEWLFKDKKYRLINIKWTIAYYIKCVII